MSKSILVEMNERTAAANKQAAEKQAAIFAEEARRVEKQLKYSSAFNSEASRESLYMAGIGAAMALSPLLVTIPLVIPAGGALILGAALINTVRARHDEVRENRKAEKKSVKQLTPH